MTTAPELRTPLRPDDLDGSVRAVNGNSRAAAPASPAPADRLGAIWANKLRILLVAAVAATLTLLLTLIVPSTYSSSVRVGLTAAPSIGTSAGELATAANDIAAQYAQLVTSESVLQPAASAAGTTSEELRSHTTAGTLASQNIVEITVQASSPAAAEQRANAIADSLAAYVQQRGAAASESYVAAVNDQLGPLDEQIAAAQKRVSTANAELARTDEDTSAQAVSAAAARLNSAQSLLTALTDRRASLATQATVQSISLAPAPQILGGATGAVQVEPRPALYSLIAGLVGLVLAAQLSVVLAERRRRA